MTRERGQAEAQDKTCWDVRQWRVQAVRVEFCITMIAEKNRASIFPAYTATFPRCKRPALVRPALLQHLYPASMPKGLDVKVLTRMSKHIGNELQALSSFSKSACTWQSMWLY